MGVRTGIVTGQEVKTWKGSDIELRILNVQLLGDSPEEVEWFDIAGEDTAPINGDRVVVWEFAQNYKVAVLTKDLIVSSVNQGERKFYSRDEDNNIISSFYLKNDGTIELESFDVDQKLVSLVHLKNDASILVKNQKANGDPLASIELKIDGTVQIDTEGDLVQNITGDITQIITGNVVLQATKFSFGDGTNELITETIKGLEEAKTLVGNTVIGGGNTVDAPGVASTGTMAIVAAPLAAIETALGLIITALNTIKV